MGQYCRSLLACPDLCLYAVPGHYTYHAGHDELGHLALWGDGFVVNALLCRLGTEGLYFSPREVEKRYADVEMCWIYASPPR